MTNLTQISAQLRQLKLSGILDSLELRLMEAESNKLSFSELLSMILADEIELRKNRRFERLLKRAQLESNQTLESFDMNFNPSINATQIRELTLCRFIEKGENIFFIGPTGTGKTHLAKAIGHAACRKSLTVEFYNFHNFFMELTKADLAHSFYRFFNRLIKADLIIIDDFGFKKLDQKSSEYLYAVVDARYGSKSMILTSNRSMSDWIKIFPDPIMANALMDRLCHNAHQVIIKGESYRKEKGVIRKKNETKNQKS